MKNLTLIAVLLITSSLFGQMSSILTDDEMYYTAFYPYYEGLGELIEEESSKAEAENLYFMVNDRKAIEYQKYTCVDEYPKEVFHLIANHKKLEITTDGKVFKLRQESKHKKFNIDMPYSHMEEETLSKKDSDGDILYTNIKVYHSSIEGIEKIIVTDLYYDKDNHKASDCYTVVMRNKEIYNFFEN